MKTIYYTIIMILINTTISFGQKGTISTINDKKYIFAESCSDNNYTSTFTFDKKAREKIISTLELYFEDKEHSNNKLVWKNIKNQFNEEDVFYIELKNKKLKIEWKNMNKSSHKEIIDKLKKISAEIVNSLK
jgi:hypothetical protein